MARSTPERGPRPTRPWLHKLVLAALGSLTAALVWAAAGGAGTLSAHGPARVTVAAIDPALTAGRGAAVNFIEQEAENADTNGTVLPFCDGGLHPRRRGVGPPGRQADRARPVRRVHADASRERDHASLRIPDAPSGGGIDAPITLTLNGKRSSTLTLTSKYSYLYNQYPFSNDPNAGLLAPRLVGHRVRVRAGVHDSGADLPDPVQANALLRRAACLARPRLRGRRHDPALGARRTRMRPGP